MGTSLPIFAIALIGCGPLEDENLEEPELFPPVAIVFRASDLDMYGAVSIQAQSGKSRFEIELQTNENFSCDQPAFHATGEDLRFEAESERFYVWNKVLPIDRTSMAEKADDTDCMEVDLSYLSMASGIIAKSATSRECIPAAVFLSLRDRKDLTPIVKERQFGTVTEAAILDRNQLGSVPWIDFVQYVVDQGRQGKVSVSGGGWGRDDALVAHELRNESGCLAYAAYIFPPPGMLFYSW